MKNFAMSAAVLALLVSGGVTAAEAQPASSRTEVFQLQVQPTEKSWGDAVQTVTAMLPKTARLVQQPATGTIAVTADDQALSSVEHYVQAINQKAARQFQVELTLTENGKVNTYKVTTRGDAAAPINSGREINFIKSITAGEHGNVVETSTLVVGLAATVTVKPIDDGKVLVHYALGHSTLNSLTNVAVAGGEVQLPDVSQDSTDQQALILNGGSIEGRFKDAQDLTYTIKVTAI